MGLAGRLGGEFEEAEVPCIDSRDVFPFIPWKGSDLPKLLYLFVLRELSWHRGLTADFLLEPTGTAMTLEHGTFWMLDRGKQHGLGIRPGTRTCERRRSDEMDPGSSHPTVTGRNCEERHGIKARSSARSKCSLRRGIIWYVPEPTAYREASGCSLFISIHNLGTWLLEQSGVS